MSHCDSAKHEEARRSRMGCPTEYECVLPTFFTLFIETLQISLGNLVRGEWIARYMAGRVSFSSSNCLLTVSSSSASSNQQEERQEGESDAERDASSKDLSGFYFDPSTGFVEFLNMEVQGRNGDACELLVSA